MSVVTCCQPFGVVIEKIIRTWRVGFCCVSCFCAGASQTSRENQSLEKNRSLKQESDQSEELVFMQETEFRRESDTHAFACIMLLKKQAK